MSVTLARPSSVPPEFIGRARQFRARLHAASDVVAAAIEPIAKQLHARAASGKPTFRDDALARLAHQWRGMPAFGRLDLLVQPGRGALHIREWRATSGHYRAAAWGDDAALEIDVGLVELTLEAGPAARRGARARWRVRTEVMASISLHAVGRRYQRARDGSDGAMHADLLTICRRYAETTAAGRDFEIPTDDGRWVGSVINMCNRNNLPGLAVRTFLPSTSC